MGEKLSRNNAIEILRVLCMMMVVTLHLFSYSNICSNIIRFSSMYWAKELITVFCGVGVNCFVLISGYFSLASNFKVSKVIHLIFETLFYSAFIYLILVGFHLIEFSLKDAFFSFLPTLTRQYWFVTTYIGAYLVSPLIKKIGNMLNEKEFRITLVSGFALFVVYYNIFFFCDNLNFGGATGIVWFVYLYLCGMYFRRFANPNITQGKRIRVYIIITLLNLCSRIPFYIMYKVTGIEIFYQGASVFGSVYNSIFVFLESIAFFNMFIHMNINLKKVPLRIISFLSSSSFAVYLIHDNNFFRNVIWEYFNYSKVNNSIKLLAAWVITVLLIYMICSVIELARQKLFRMLESRFHIELHTGKLITKIARMIYYKFDEKVEE